MNYSVLSCQYHSSNAPYSSSIYTSLLPEGQEDEASGLPKGNGFSYIGERSIETYVHFLSFFKMLTTYRYGDGYWSSLSVVV